MRLVSFSIDGHASFGAVVGDKVVDLHAELGQRYPDLKALIAEDGVAAAAAAVAGAVPSLSLEQLDLLPVIPNPGKIICIGLNYEKHRAETGRDKTASPTLFSRFADTQIGHRVPAWRPRLSEQMDFEGELAVVIGKSGRYGFCLH